MKILSSGADVDGFLAQVGESAQPVLMLDFDGTLAPFQQDPSAVTMYPGAKSVLDAIQAQGATRLAIVSGRTIEDLQPLLDINPLPELWGCHGMERLTVEGVYLQAPIPEDTAGQIERIANWAKGPLCTARFEVKTSGVAFHWRGASPQEITEIETAIRQKWGPLAWRYDLQLRNFDGGLEIRYAKYGKAYPVRKACTRAGPGVPVAYAGDDETDEDAFRALRAPSLGILVREEARETEADIWLQPPTELVGFLERWLKALTKE